MAYTPPNTNGQATSANSAPMVIASDQSTIKTKLANDVAQTTGTITTSTSTISTGLLSGVGSATVQISGTYAGVNVTFEGSIDNTLWVAIPAMALATATPVSIITTGVLTANSTNLYNISPILGLNYIRVRATAFTSGTANVIIQPSAQFYGYNVNVTQTTANQLLTQVNQPTASSLNATVVQGTAGASAWLTREAVATTSTVTQVTPATTSTTLKASNAARKAIILYNGGTSDMYVAYGATASSTAFTFILPSLATTTIRGEEYSGIITGIWIATGGNNMQVSEIV